MVLAGEAGMQVVPASPMKLRFICVRLRRPHQPHFIKKSESKLSIFLFVRLAGEAGIEPTSMVLETTILTVVLLP